MYSTLLCIWCLIFTASPAQTQHESPLDVPEQIRLEKDSDAQILKISWDCNLVSVFDIEIYRTEFMDIVFNETVKPSSENNAGECHWNWTSEVPLECTSHSVRIRSRDQLHVSEWSPLQTIEGNDLPDNREAQMYPQDKVVQTGSNSTFCCILGEGQVLQRILYMKSVMTEVRLSRRTYAVTRTLQPPSNVSGTNIYCQVATDVTNNSSKPTVTGAVIFVGYPPEDEELVCETQDMASAVCRWKEGRPTHLRGRKRATAYTLNERSCKIVSGIRKCLVDQWKDDWILVAKNPLGVKKLTDSAPLTHRVRPVAPGNLTALVNSSRKASLQWSWQYQGYQAFLLTCQVNLQSNGFSDIRNYSGAGLSQVLLEDLWPYESYRVRVRCAAEKHFWKWGDWSLESSFQTKMERPNTPDLWIWMGSENSGQILWKPLSRRESNGDLLGYEVTQGSASGEGEEHRNVPVSQLSVPLSVQDNASDVIVTLLVRNSEWASQTTQLIPKYWADLDVTGSEISSRDGGFDMSWPASSNASRGYALEWFNTSCGQYCSVDWRKVPETTTSARIESRGLEAGVRYTISVYALSDEAPALLERRHGYIEEMVPAEPVPSLEASQDESSVVLSWQAIPMLSQRGFVRGYSVYLASLSEYTLLVNITDPSVRNHTVKWLGLGTYKFTVRAYTSAGEDGGSTVSIKLEPSTDVILFEILIALATMSVFLILVTVLCYRKRQWVKKAFYPEIPAPKLPGQWGTSQATMDVKPSPHSMVHIVENPQWDSSKEGLVLSGEDEDIDESDSENTDTDSDEPGLLRYYNQVVGDSGQAPRLPVDSSSSSVGSADTDVTYTGIQTSPGPLDTPPQVEVQPAGGYRPQGQVVLPPQQQDQPEVEAEAPSTASFGGYKPQCAWRPDSPDGNAFEGSVGSPTSVNSSQFLIPDVSSEDTRNGTASTTWIPSFLSGKP